MSEESAPDLSVVICTLNRKDLLLEAIGSVQSDVGTRNAETVVVDNGSTDGSVEAVEALAEDGLGITLVREPKLGLSHARNAGITAARGRVVAFLDDDAAVQPGWCAAILDIFSTIEGVAAVGGKSILSWPETGRPKWLPARYEPYYSGVDFGPSRQRLEPPRIPYGVNMALTREWLERLGGFDPQLGRRGRSLISCEEQELFLRLRAAGGEIWYEPAAIVHHRVEPERTHRRWVVRRAFAQGRTHGLAPHLKVALTAPSGGSPGAQQIAPAPLSYRLILRASYELGLLAGWLGRGIRGSHS